MRRKGFTLIELIVVMAIIAILVLIAAPKFMGYTEKAKLTKVLNNLKASETAAELYYMENDGWPKQPTEYSAAQLNTWVEEFKSISGETVVLEPVGKYYDVDWNLMKGFMEKPDNNFKYIIQNPVGDVYYANELTAAGEQTKFAGDNQVTTEPEPTTEANLAPTAIINLTPETNIKINTNIVWSSLSSTDPDGDLITNVEWEGKQDVYVTAGTYTVRLRVQDSKGLWSNWTEKIIEVKTPVIIGYSNNLIPVMTSDTAPSGIATASDIYSANYSAWKAFDRITNSNWNTRAGIKTGWLAYEFDTQKTIRKYSIKSTYNTTDIGSSLMDWTFEGTNDGTTWTILDTKVNQSSWGTSQLREYVINNNTPYKKYRINVSKNHGGGYVIIQQVEMMEAIFE